MWWNSQLGGNRAPQGPPLILQGTTAAQSQPPAAARGWPRTVNSPEKSDIWGFNTDLLLLKCSGK